MDSKRPMSEGHPDGAAASERDPRVEELLRVNARLAAEVRSLAQGRTSAPRSTATPVARRIAALSAERDGLLATRDELTAELHGARLALEGDRVHRESLERDNAELAATVAHLRSGARGALRRVLARIGR